MSVLAGFVMIQQIISVRNVRGRRELEEHPSIVVSPPRPPPPPVASPMELLASWGQYITPRKDGESGAPLGGPGGELTDAAVIELVTTGLLSPSQKKQVSMERNKAAYTIVGQNA